MPAHHPLDRSHVYAQQPRREREVPLGRDQHPADVVALDRVQKRELHAFSPPRSRMTSA